MILWHVSYECEQESFTQMPTNSEEENDLYGANQEREIKVHNKLGQFYSMHKYRIHKALKTNKHLFQ